MTWHRIASVAEVPPGDRKTFHLQGKELTLLHTEDGIWCIDFRCPHTGGPLGNGIVTGVTLECPLHKWRFDLRDGSHNRNPKDCPPAGVYQLKLEGEHLLVELP